MPKRAATVEILASRNAQLVAILVILKRFIYGVSMPVALAVDLGGTKIEAALIDDEGRILEGSRKRVATGRELNASMLEDAISALVQIAQEHPRWPDVTSVGVGAAGPVDLKSGSISPINMPAVRQFPLVAALQRATGMDEVTLRLDGTCIALAEAWLGAARGVQNALVMVVSTGVGGGIISGGRVVQGASGNAGHIGQILIQDPANDLESATVEGLASGPRTTGWAQAQGWVGHSGEDLARAAADRDEVALEAVARSARAVGIGLANAATLLDLELAVVGGGFASVTPDYIEAIQNTVRTHAVNGYASAMRVTSAALGGDAPLIGAAALAHRRDLLA